jgi:hypothetical protein
VVGGEGIDDCAEAGEFSAVGGVESGSVGARGGRDPVGLELGEGALIDGFEGR